MTSPILTMSQVPVAVVRGEPRSTIILNKSERIPNPKPSSSLSKCNGFNKSSHEISKTYSKNYQKVAPESRVECFPKSYTQEAGDEELRNGAFKFETCVKFKGSDDNFFEENYKGSIQRIHDYNTAELDRNLTHLSSYSEDVFLPPPHSLSRADVNSPRKVIRPFERNQSESSILLNHSCKHEINDSFNCVSNLPPKYSGSGGFSSSSKTLSGTKQKRDGSGRAIRRRKRGSDPVVKNSKNRIDSVINEDELTHSEVSNSNYQADCEDKQPKLSNAEQLLNNFNNFKFRSLNSINFINTNDVDDNAQSDGQNGSLLSNSTSKLQELGSRLEAALDSNANLAKKRFSFTGSDAFISSKLSESLPRLNKSQNRNEKHRTVSLSSIISSNNPPQAKTEPNSKRPSIDNTPDLDKTNCSMMSLSSNDGMTSCHSKDIFSPDNPPKETSVSTSSRPTKIHRHISLSHSHIDDFDKMHLRSPDNQLNIDYMYAHKKSIGTDGEQTEESYFGTHRKITQSTSAEGLRFLGQEKRPSSSEWSWAEAALSKIKIDKIGEKVEARMRGLKSNALSGGLRSNGWTNGIRSGLRPSSWSGSFRGLEKKVRNFGFSWRNRGPSSRSSSAKNTPQHSAKEPPPRVCRSCSLKFSSLDQDEDEDAKSGK